MAGFFTGQGYFVSASSCLMAVKAVLASPNVEEKEEELEAKLSWAWGKLYRCC